MVKTKRNKPSFDLMLADVFPETRPADAGPVVEYRAKIAWKDGIPYLVDVPTTLSAQPENSLRALMRKCMDLPYDGLNPALKGLSQGEAMIVQMMRQAAEGDQDARTDIMDRLLGRPQQNIKSVALTGDLNDFLDKIAAETRIETVPMPRAEVVEEYSGEDL